jgi:hypothetical protein
VGWDDDASGPTSVYLAGEKEATDDKDIYAEFHAAAAEVWRNRGLTHAQKKAKVAALKVQRNLKKAGRKARRTSDAMKPKKVIKPKKPNTGPTP